MNGDECIDQFVCFVSMLDSVILFCLNTTIQVAQRSLLLRGIKQTLRIRHADPTSANLCHACSNSTQTSITSNTQEH